MQNSLGVETKGFIFLLELESVSRVIFPTKVPADFLNWNRYR